MQPAAAQRDQSCGSCIYPILLLLPVDVLDRRPLGGTRTVSLAPVPYPTGTQMAQRNR